MNNQDETNSTDQNLDSTAQTQDESNLQEELAKMTDLAKRALADLQNYKRKADEERVGLLNMGQVNIIRDLLPVLDNFTRAFSHIPEDLTGNEWVMGVTQIEKQLLTIIKNVGLEEIPTVGQKLDPNLHEVIAETEGEPDIIVQEIEKGYTFKGKLIRASKVLVGKSN